jgi:hypothetical protein
MVRPHERVIVPEFNIILIIRNVTLDANIEDRAVSQLPNLVSNLDRSLYSVLGPFDS